MTPFLSRIIENSSGLGISGSDSPCCRFETGQVNWRLKHDVVKLCAKTGEGKKGIDWVSRQIARPLEFRDLPVLPSGFCYFDCH